MYDLYPLSSTERPPFWLFVCFSFLWLGPLRRLQYVHFFDTRIDWRKRLLVDA